VRLALPQDVLVRLVEPDATTAGECQEIALLDGVEGGVLLQEIRDAVADDGGFH
jgi:hypothetical protein